MVIFFQGAIIPNDFLRFGTRNRTAFRVFFAFNEVDTIMNVKKCSQPRPQGMMSVLNLVCNLSK